MSEERVKLTIDGIEVQVPPGTLIVDAAKQAGLDIPVFCYHPKLDPVGMCRMCLVEIGRPAVDRATGKPLLDESGKPVIRFGPNLETACTTPVGEGWVVRVESEKGREGRKQILEYLLTSHPLDCPICDKGGECPLQNLTMAHGPGESRFLFEDKIKLAKHVPLGELIWLDRERCIQCARCIRFQDEIADDAVIGFYQRGRRLEIVTFSDPGFDSYFSGNTTDICPVGALTTADFRFGARPWELNNAASICPHCPVGCNLTLNTRREAQAGGGTLIKRILPRQHEAVNEVWICDKGRFAHHFVRSPERLTEPLVRDDGELRKATWDQALIAAAEGLRTAGKNVVGLAGGSLSNESLFNFRQLISGMGGRSLLGSTMGGGDLVPLAGVGSGTNLADLGAGDAILVIASDLHEEAPIWWLRVKQAAERGATLIVASARPTRLTEYADHRLSYRYGNSVATALGLLGVATETKELKPFTRSAEVQAAGEAFAQSRDAIIFFGQEGLGFDESRALADACARLLLETDHVGRSNNGLIPVWPKANTQGAWELGLAPPEGEIAEVLGDAKAAYIAGADPANGDPAAKTALEKLSFLVVQDLFLTETAELADIVLPAQAFAEGEGSYTSGERRVQRFYPAVPAWGQARPDWLISAALGAKLGLNLEHGAASLVFAQMAEQVPAYEGIDYRKLARVEPQWPRVGGEDLYFGGTSYANRQGLGVQLAPDAEALRDELGRRKLKIPEVDVQVEGMLLVPITKLYAPSATVAPSEVLDLRLIELQLRLHPDDARALGLNGNGRVRIAWNEQSAQLPVYLDAAVPRGAALIPRNTGIRLDGPVSVSIEAAE